MEPIADLVLVTLFLLVSFPFLGSTSLVALAATATTVAAAAILTIWRGPGERRSVLTNPWFASVVLLAPIWLARQVLPDEGSAVKAIAAVGVVAAAGAVSWFLVRGGRRRARSGALAIVAIVVTALALNHDRPHLPGYGAAVQPRVLPNVILVTMDTVRADHTSAYGYPADHSSARRAHARGNVLPQCDLALEFHTPIPRLALHGRVRVASGRLQWLARFIVRSRRDHDRRGARRRRAHITC
jgi:hypothetical protein